MDSEAIYIVKTGAPEKAFELRKHKIEELESDELLIEVEGFGLNYADVMARLGLYREAPEFPCVVGGIYRKVEYVICAIVILLNIIATGREEGNYNSPIGILSSKILKDDSTLFKLSK